MKSLLCLGMIAATVFTSAPAQDRLSYPSTAKVDVVDTYFGTHVADPYRWLEDDTAPAVTEWVSAQNAVTFGYLNAIPFRAALKKRLEQLFDHPRFGSPYRRKGYTIFSKNEGLQNQDVIYVQSKKDTTPRVLLDPNSFSTDGRAKLASVTYSADMRYLAYGVSEGGSDWVTIYVMELATRTLLPDRLRWIKFGSAAWKGDGFYYSRYDAPTDTARQLSSMNQAQKVYYHRVGTSQSEDLLVHADPEHPQRMLGVGLSDDERFEVLWKTEPGHNGNAFAVRDNERNDRDFRPIVNTFDDHVAPFDHVAGKLLVQTNRGAPNGRVVLIDPDRPAPEHWKDIVPEKEYPIAFATTAGNKLIIGYRKDVATRVYVHSLDGTPEREVALPSLGTAWGFGGWREDTTVFYTFSSFTYPSAIYEYDLHSGVSRLFKQANVQFNPDEYTTEQIFFASKDGTRIPMFIVYKKGLARNGKNPTLMYAYGGFNISTPPGFDPLRIALLEQGFIYASVNIRGGSEYGERWHEQGMVLNKQNVFDDFIAAAEWLCKAGYTSSEKLAMTGGSNGGLLVGAVMTQRPELFKVAIPDVGVMDMLRYQKFTIGYTWSTDYGSSDDSTQFRYIYKYSPLHNLKPGVSYPATLVTTADHDDRVVPAHSFKFIATLQEMQAGPAPVLIRIQTRSGHGASSTSVRIDQRADVYAFLMKNLGVIPQF